MIEKCETGKHYYDRRNYITCPFCEKIKNMQFDKDIQATTHCYDARWDAATQTWNNTI